MLNKKIVDKMVSILGELSMPIQWKFSEQLLEDSVIGNTFALFGPGIIKK